MTDPINQILESSPTHLADLLAIGEPSAEWTPDEMRDSLDHLLAIPFETALSQLPPDLAVKIRAFADRLQVHAAADRVHVWTLGELFHHPEPPVEMLKFAKEFGKAIQTQGKTAWPAQVGAVVYYSSLGLALLRHSKSIGRLTDGEMKRGFKKLADLAWLDEPTKRLFDEARTTLSAC